MKPYFITTAIDYTNGKPHIGHAYEKVLADVMARYYRLKGREVFFLTGVDQHGQKVEQSATAEGVNPITYVKRITKGFVKLWEKFGISYDGWAETSDELHKKAVQGILQKLYDEEQIYKNSYAGFYSVRQEQFITDKERGEDGQFGEEWGEVVELEEENYYFKLAEHVDWLKAYLQAHPEFIEPAYRVSDVSSALEQWALGEEGGDLCISRPKKRLSWGIELPFDEEFVTYVWFDALSNYITFSGYGATAGEDLPDFDSLWPCDAHVIGKDILRPPHGIYWPIMLHALGFSDEQMPKLLVHGWWNDKKGEKQSKSLGNVVDPSELIDIFGADGLRYYLMSDIATGKDANFDFDRLLTISYNKELAGGLGNLLNRSLNMNKRYAGGALQAPSNDSSGVHLELKNKLEELPKKYQEKMESYQVHQALEVVFDLIAECNAFVEKMAPWELAKNEDEEAKKTLSAVLYALCESLLHSSYYLEPFMPEAAAKMRQQLNWDGAKEFTWDKLHWGMLESGHLTGKPKPLFPRVEISEETSSEAQV